MKLLFWALGLLGSFSAEAGGSFKNLQLQAAGLTCSMCSNAINKALRTLPEVADVETDLKNNLFRITLQDGAIPNFDAFSQKVQDAGFSVAKLTVDYLFEPTAITSDEHLTLGGLNYHLVGVKKTTIQGWQTLQFVDKPFVVAKEFKKWQKASDDACIKTGLMATCCPGNSATGVPQRVYHVTL